MLIVSPTLMLSISILVLTSINCLQLSSSIELLFAHALPKAIKTNQVFSSNFRRHPSLSPYPPFSSSCNSSTPRYFHSLLAFASGGFGGGGSGTSNTKSSPSSAIPKLSLEAKELLKQFNGDLNQAQSAFFKKRLEEEESIQLQSSSSTATVTETDDWDPVYSNKNTPEQKRALHNAKVTAAWDSIALFLPIDYATQAVNNNQKNQKKGAVGGRFLDNVVRRRLGMIAQACIPSSSTMTENLSNFRILDVGCGDGAIVPFLDDQYLAIAKEVSKKQKKKEPKVSGEETGNQKKKKKVYTKVHVDPTYYHGIDLSPVMIDMAKQTYSTHCFQVKDFQSVAAGDDEVSHYNTILFNGSIQFFPDLLETLNHAAALISTGGRIVLSHVQGGSFVKDEVRKNPMAGACTFMPQEDELEDVASKRRAF